jgi:hypothetical protein
LGWGLKKHKNSRRAVRAHSAQCSWKQQRIVSLSGLLATEAKGIGQKRKRRKIIGAFANSPIKKAVHFKRQTGTEFSSSSTGKQLLIKPCKKCFLAIL